MRQREPQQNMYELSGATRGPRIALAAAVGLWVALGWWLLLGGGLAIAGGWFGWIPAPGLALRSVCLAAAFSVYYIRILFTEFVFLRRGVSWSEAATVASWLLMIFLLLAIAGGTNRAAFAAAGFAGVALFVSGSAVNSFAEHARHRWKQRAENRGKLYTGGLFRYSRHPNYLGDLVLFGGLCLVAGRWVTAIVPVVMLAGFVFVNIPMLDAHLRGRYGAAFEQYAARTRKLIPFVY